MLRVIVHCVRVRFLFTLREAKNHVSAKMDMDEMDIPSAERQPQCPKEIEDAITEALRMFKMI